ncbi:MAG: histone deacetylase [Deltaproteobacteria bacterium]
MNNKIGIIKDSRYFDHRIADKSLENPNRIKNLYLALGKPSYADALTYYRPREATTKEVQDVHSKFYIDQIRELALSTDPHAYDRDTYLMEETVYTAQLAAGGCLVLVDKIMTGEVDYGFALVRPPGHHAEPGRGMGFCVLNNAAITAAYLRRTYGLDRILIFDFDVHHGNGTQEAFYDSDRVLVASFHQKNLFPYSGGANEIGRDRGRGYNINVPVFPQFGNLEYTYLTGRLIGAIVEQYLPQIILLSAGYDGHAEDSISDILLTTPWFTSCARMLKQFARDACEKRILFILEGGYNPAVLEHSVLATLDGLMEKAFPVVGISPSERAERLLSSHPAHAFWSY